MITQRLTKENGFKTKLNKNILANIQQVHIPNFTSDYIIKLGVKCTLFVANLIIICLNKNKLFTSLNIMYRIIVLCIVHKNQAKCIPNRDTRSFLKSTVKQCFHGLTHIKEEFLLYLFLLSCTSS